jgi:hypothetical protein
MSVLLEINFGSGFRRAPALTSFRFGFFNGEHRFRQATIMPSGETFEAAWGDSGGEDPYFVEGGPEATGGVVTAVVRGVADIQIPAGPANADNLAVQAPWLCRQMRRRAMRCRAWPVAKANDRGVVAADARCRVWAKQLRRRRLDQAT